MPVTMKQVSQLAGTSRPTVSYVLRGQWKQHGISESTYHRVMEAVRKTNYRPNRVARSLVSQKTHLIGVQLASFQNEYYGALVKSIGAAVREHGYHVLLAAPAAAQNEAEELTCLYEQQVDGLVLTTQRPGEMRDVFAQLRSANVPMVFIENPPQEADYSVLDDNEDQARLATEHLIHLGHRNIAHIAGTVAYRSGDMRRKGFLDCMKQHSLAVPDEYVQVGSYEFDLAYQSARRLLALPTRPTAIYCANDFMGLAAIKAIEEAGLRVPRDISIVGHGDDIPFQWFTRIPLTTIRQMPEQTAHKAIDMVIDLIEGREVPQPRIHLPGTLIVRDSSTHPSQDIK